MGREELQACRLSIALTSPHPALPEFVLFHSGNAREPNPDPITELNRLVEDGRSVKLVVFVGRDLVE